MKANIPHSTQYINYIIVVHGIGDQRVNETVLPVINRFAEVRQNAKAPQRREVTTLGMITSQTGRPSAKNGELLFADCKPWSEFKNIPHNPAENLPPFLGEPSFTGENIRFVDMHWADIMEEEFNEVGEKTGIWAKSLLGRLEAKAKGNKGDFAADKEDQWILPILYQLEETLIFFDNLLSIRFPFVEDLIFNKFLGDVQLYGEYQQIRGRAVRRFHEMFEKIERSHIAEFCPDSNLHDRYHNAFQNMDIVPRYTIIAHSLGTVMALDALLYAHIHKDIYEYAGKYSNLPFVGYASANSLVGDYEAGAAWLLENRREYLGENWARNVANFITLGSPIDKFLTLWWNNYQYLGGGKEADAKRFDTVDQLFDKRPLHERIKHYNYCDEQDPVGHHLNRLCGKRVYDRIFQLEEDIVYHRYGTPGVAHVDYWDDIDLFKRIVRLAVDGESKQQLEQSGDFKDFVYKPKTFRWVMFFSYGLFQIFAALLFTFWGLWGFESPSWKMSVLGSLGLVGSIYVLRKFIKLQVWWRQALKHKNGYYRDTSQGLGAKSKAMRLLMIGLMLAIICAAQLYIPAHIHLSKIGLPDIYRYLTYFTDMFVVGGIGMLLHYLLYTRRRGAPNMSIWYVPELYTAMACGAMIVVCGGLTYMGIYPMLDWIPYEAFYSNVVSGFLVSSFVAWAYTLSCFFIARRTVRKAEGL